MILESIFLGLIEGITEFLPVSSTGHLILAARWLKLPATDFLKSFEIAIQLGAVLAVVALYGRKFLLNSTVIKKIIAAFIPTGIVGFLFYKIIRGFLGDEKVVLWALALGGLVIVVFELFNRKKEKSGGEIVDITYKQAFLIGLAQTVSVIPGVSRAAATILGGLSLDLGRKAVIEFSFLLAVPTMLAATGYDLLKNAGAFNGGDFGTIAVGFAVSFATAIFSIKFLLNFTKNNNFISFGVYRIILALIFWLAIV